MIPLTLSPFTCLTGTGVNRVLILGSRECADPASRTGGVFHRAVRRLGANVDSFLLLSGATPADLEQVVRRYEPCAILALGLHEASVATGRSWDKIELIEGYTFECIYDAELSVIPTFDPAFLRQGHMTHFGCLLRDIGLAIDVAKERRKPALPPLCPSASYQLYPTAAEAEAFALDLETRIAGDRRAAHPSERVALAYDIETPYSRSETEEAAEEDETVSTAIDSIQFSLAPGSGIFMPWRAPYIDIAKRILATDCVKLGWNTWRFDDPRILANGLAINGTKHDLMWAWHHLQPDLSRGLQFAAKFLGWTYAWKHLSGSRPEFYGITDCDVLQTIAPVLFRSLKDGGLYKAYERHIVMLEPILSRMSERGMPVNPTRYDEVRFELSCRVDGGLEELQELVPLQCKPTKAYKKTPKDTKGLMLMPVKDYDEKAGGFPERWHKILPWKPSNQGLTKYAEFKGHPLPRDFKTKKITFNQMHMKRLYAKTKDPLYKAILDYKDAATVLSNHIVNWAPDASGRVHSTFYYDPATGQLSSRRPNIQNAPKHKEGQGELFRSIIRAKEGKTLIEFDYKAFHALTLGFEAGDADYMRLARLDIHSYVAAHLLHLSHRDRLLALPDSELGAQLNAIKKAHKAVRDQKAKRAILGYGFGLGYRKLYEMNREDFENESEARKLLLLLDSLFPKTKAWRDTIRVQAHEQGYLCSRHGYIRRFWEVLKWTPEGLRPGGEQSESAIAFLPANDAFGRIKEAILELQDYGFLERFGFINTIHDSLLFECPDTLIDECLAVVHPIMEKPSMILVDSFVAPGGLVCEVSASVGKSWEKMKELKGAKREAAAM